MWCWGTMNVHDFSDYVTGTDIDSFFEWSSKNSSTTYFHNLAYDGSFVIDALLRRGYVHVKDRPEAPQSFSTLIDGMGKFYAITVNFEGRVTEYRDSYKKIPMPVSAISTAFDVRSPRERSTMICRALSAMSRTMMSGIICAGMC